MSAADQMSFKRLSLFPTLIGVAVLDDESLPRSPLARLILDRFEKEGGADILGAWESEGPLLPPNDPALVALTRQCLNLISMASNRPAQKAKGWRITSRAVVMEKGDSMAFHTHSGWDWEATFFLDCGTAGAKNSLVGDLEFQDPRGAAPMMAVPDLTFEGATGLAMGISQSLTPKAGNLIVYPAWLLHGVANHEGEGKRLSITLRFAEVLDPNSPAQGSLDH